MFILRWNVHFYQQQTKYNDHSIYNSSSPSSTTSSPLFSISVICVRAKWKIESTFVFTSATMGAYIIIHCLFTTYIHRSASLEPHHRLLGVNAVVRLE